MFLAAKEFPLPVEYRFLPLEEVFHEPPADMADRTVIFLDCGNIDRMPVEFLGDGATSSTSTITTTTRRFGDVNLVDVEASSTAEIVFELAGMPRRGAHAEIADALYVGLVTDTGKFMYENTDARLPPDGRRADRGRGGRQRHLPPPLRARADREAALVARALERIERRRRRAGDHLHHRRRLPCDGRERGPDRGDHRPPAHGRRRLGGRGGPRPAEAAARKVSLRSTDGSVDVSARSPGRGWGRARARRRLRHRPRLRGIVEFLLPRRRSSERRRDP